MVLGTAVEKMLFIGQSKWTKTVFCRVVFLELLKWFQTFFAAGKVPEMRKLLGRWAVGRQTNIDSHLNSDLAKTIGPL